MMGRNWGRWAASVGALAFATSSVAFTGPASAQAPAPSQPAALSVSPPTTSVDVSPGQKVTKKIGLDNISDLTRNVAVEVHNFSASGEEGEAKLEQDASGVYALSQWIKVTPSTASIAPHGHQDFQVEINVPSNAPPGGHFGAIVFAPSSTNPGEGASLSVVSQVTSLILLRVPGDANEKASIASLNICKPKSDVETKCDESPGFLQGGPLSISTRVQNSGNVQVQPTGTITIRNIFGKKVKTIEVPGAQVLPESVRRFDSKWDQKQLLGLYKVKVDLKYGTTGQTLTAEKSVWAAPVGGILLLVVGAFVIFFLGWLPRKRWKKAFKALTAGD